MSYENYLWFLFRKGRCTFMPRQADSCTALWELRPSPGPWPTANFLVLGLLCARTEYLRFDFVFFCFSLRQSFITAQASLSLHCCCSAPLLRADTLSYVF